MLTAHAHQPVAWWGEGVGTPLRGLVAAAAVPRPDRRLRRLGRDRHEGGRPHPSGTRRRGAARYQGNRSFLAPRTRQRGQGRGSTQKSALRPRLEALGGKRRRRAVPGPDCSNRKHLERVGPSEKPLQGWGGDGGPRSVARAAHAAASPLLPLLGGAPLLALEPVPGTRRDAVEDARPGRVGAWRPPSLGPAPPLRGHARAAWSTGGAPPKKPGPLAARAALAGSSVVAPARDGARGRPVPAPRTDGARPPLRPSAVPWPPKPPKKGPPRW